MPSPEEFINIVLQLEQRRYEERLRQVQITFIVAIILLIVGIMSICVGLCVLLILRNTGESLTVTAGITSSIMGGFSTAVSGLILKFNTGVNRRLDQTAHDLLEFARFREEILVRQHILDQIMDPTQKDRALTTLARKLQDSTTAINMPPQEQSNGGLMRLLRRPKK